MVDLFDMIAGMNITAQEHVTDYSQITDYIFIGSDLCKGNICPVHSEEFKKLDIHTEIDLDMEHDEPVTPYLDAYLRLPTPDHQAPTQQQLRIGAFVIHQTVLSQKRVYVHCHNGHGRSPAVVVAYLVQYQQLNVADSINLIKMKRPEIHLEPSQVSVLEQFQKEYSL